VRDSAFECELPVRTPYRLDLTANALRRLSTNVVDRFEDGEYSRALQDAAGVGVVRVRQKTKDALDVCIDGKDGGRFLPTVARMLGTDVALRDWNARVQAVKWLSELARELRGLHPPQYPTLWEAATHAIIFQQISIYAAAAIMQRMIERFGERAPGAEAPLYLFPSPAKIANASVDNLRAAGLSAHKVTALHSAAESVASGALTAAEIAGLSSAQAIVRLSAFRGLGPWSAAVILLRGLGRLDVFPLKDSGVAASVRLLSGNRNVNLERLLARLGKQRGMLYFHLLLGRLGRSATAATSPLL